MPMPPGRFTGPPPGPQPQGLSSMLPPQGGGMMGPGGMPPGMPPKPGPGAGMGPGGPQPGPTPPSGGGGGGLKDVFDEVQSVLDAIASILPEHAEEIDSIKTQLSEVLAKAISGGAAFQGRTEGPSLKSPASPSFPA